MKMEIASSLIQHFRPLYTVQGPNAYSLHGSATLVKGDRRHFILTCAHCLKSAKNSPLIMPCGSFLWNLKVFTEIYNSGGDTDDKIDILIYQIPDAIVLRMSASCKFIHLNEIYSVICMDAYSVVACGFPLSWNKSHLHKGVVDGNLIPQSQAFKSTTYSKDHRAYKRDGYDISVHSAFDYPRKFKLSEGGEAFSPLPRGMSGGPVFIVRAGTRGIDFLFTGLVFEGHSQGYLVATLANQIFETLYNADHK